MFLELLSYYITHSYYITFLVCKKWRPMKLILILIVSGHRRRLQYCIWTRAPTLPSPWQKCDRSADGRLDHGEIEEFCRELLRRPDLDAVFTRYSANGCILSTVDLRDFLQDQGEDSSLVHAQSLILTYELNEWGTITRTYDGPLISHSFSPIQGAVSKK